MARSFRNWVVEVSSTTGTGPYSLGGAPVGTSYFTYRQKFANGEDKIVYWVTNQTRTKWEKNRFGTLTYGLPDTLSRNVVESTNGDAPVSWSAGDTPLRIYVAPDADIEELVAAMGLGPTRPGALRYGLWSKEDTPSAGRHTVMLQDGAGDPGDLPFAVVDPVAHLLFGSVFKINVQTFTSSGTYTPHAKMRFGYAVGKGGGGGGGNSSVDPAFSYGTGGGGEGNTAMKWFTLDDIGVDQPVTIGAGGAGGGSGGTTSLGSLLSAAGGQNGGATVGSRGASGSVGDVVIPGATGGCGMIITAADAVGVGGEGGGAGGGIAAAAGSGGTFPSGGAALANSGGGGGGAAARSAGPGLITGGAGGSGFLYVVEFLAP